jgi:hypothetical protein
MPHPLMLQHRIHAFSGKHLGNFTNGATARRQNMSDLEWITWLTWATWLTWNAFSKDL